MFPNEQQSLVLKALYNPFDLIKKIALKLIRIQFIWSQMAKKSNLNMRIFSTISVYIKAV